MGETSTQQGEVRIYHLEDPDGGTRFIITDDKNHVLFPEGHRERVLVEYGHDGQVEDRFDFHETTDELKVGEKTTTRPIHEKDSFMVWPDVETLPVICQVWHHDAEAFRKCLEDYHERLEAHRREKEQIHAQRVKAVAEYAERCRQLEEQQLADLGPIPTLELEFEVPVD